MPTKSPKWGGNSIRVVTPATGPPKGLPVTPLGTPGSTPPPGVTVNGVSGDPVGGQPLDPAFEAYRASAGRNVALSDAESKYQLGRLGNEYGIGDTSNPYSKAALLQEHYNRSVRGTTNSMAGAGQLYSGAYGRAQNENARNYSIDNDALQRAFEASKHGILAGQANTYANNALGVDDTRFQSLLNALGR